MTTTETVDALREAPLRLVATKIKQARGRLTLDQLADKVGTSRQHLISLEQAKHRPRLAMLERIAEATDQPIDFFLVGGPGEPDPFPAKAA